MNHAGEAARRRATRTSLLRCAIAIALLVAVTSLAGCTIRVGGETTASAENDRLRTANQALERRVLNLRDELQLREGEVESLRQQLALAREAPEVDAALAPTLARLNFARHSGPVDLDGDGRHDLIRVYLRPQDQRGRLLPVSGRAVVRAVILPEEADDGEDAEPRVVAERRYDAPAFDAAWRDSFAGTHFTLELPLPETLTTGETELTVRVSFVQAGTGIRLSQQDVMTVRR